MAIIISKDGGKVKRVERSPLGREKDLEEFVASNPESLPMEDIKDDLRLLVIGRQFSTASGPIDVLALDAEGDIYVIETKLFQNADKRRVIAQMLDYGAALWRAYEDGAAFLTEVETVMRQRGGFNTGVQEAFGLEDEEEIEELRGLIRQSVSSGRFRFIVLMDDLDERLKDLILFLNERSKFTIYAVSMEFYHHDGYEIVIPKLFGAEAHTHGDAPVAVDEETFFQDAARRLTADALAAVRTVYQFARRSGAEIGWGRGVKSGSFNARYRQITAKSLFTVTSKGTLHLNFKWLNDSPDALSFRQRYMAAIRTAGLAPLPVGSDNKFIRVRNWHSRAGDFVQVMDGLLSTELQAL